ncbi:MULTISPECIES: molybdate ABC transporter substrate-binding protein [unclassified Paenibacillus]|uniref:molybdate ABC transporter substrate-binding protein n=1 Tax=unclassified Paenibacillus TaxID=185978 RepID=UPI000FE21230|nr:MULTISPECIES: molybdate ABC transporter substrate-binding protein [unclassified Paenibacillus]MCM3175124.1 molybdate ABC transporter substrate-binding protein [Paenibacillus sp. MER 99-2]
MRKRIGYVLGSMSLGLALVLSGCGASTDTPDTSSATDSTASNTATSGESSATENVDPQETVDLTISAAASLTDAMKEIETNFEAANPNINLNFNFGASGALQQQIEQGAPSDIFVSAASKNMNALVEENLIAEADQQNLLQNSLVAVVSADRADEVSTESDLTSDTIKTIAIGIPESVPAGTYAKEALTNAKLWDQLESKLVQGKDVRQVLQYVETGNADAGFVYKTDALTSDQVKIAFEVDKTSYTPANYPVGIIEGTKHRTEAEQFYTYLQSPEVLDVFAKYGFSIPE